MNDQGLMRAVARRVDSGEHLSHDMPCPRCGHARHTFLPCSDRCDCRASVGVDLAS